jgi:hypothetical protein
VKELRTEVIRRLGPPAKDPEEVRLFESSFPEHIEIGMANRLDPSTIGRYAPYLRRLGLRLKRRAVARSAPLTLKFSEQVLRPEQPGYSHIIVTIETVKELSSGYVAVQFSGQPYSLGCDFQDSKLALPIDLPPENSAVTELLKSTANYVLQIGKTAFAPNKPIHVEARASVPIHVSTVTFLEE